MNPSPSGACVSDASGAWAPECRGAGVVRDRTAQSSSGRAPLKLLDRVRTTIRARHYSPRTEKAYVGWIKRFVVYHGKRHPGEMGEPEITEFLSWLATHRHLSASTQNQALSAVLFLYREVLGHELPWVSGVIRARRPVRLPVVLTPEEVDAILGQLNGPVWIMGSLLYGAGLRLMECCRLRVKDLEPTRGEILVRDGKGRKDRITVLPRKVKAPLIAHLERVRDQHGQDLREGAGAVVLPDAMARKYPRAAQEWAWQWVFPATRTYRDPESGERRRHHLHESMLQRAVKEAVRRSGIPKPATPHSLRHHADFRIMPLWWTTGLQGRGIRSRRRPRCRHNQRASRKVRSRSSGRKRGVLTPTGSVRARAFSLMLMSAWR